MNDQQVLNRCQPVIITLARVIDIARQQTRFHFKNSCVLTSHTRVKDKHVQVKHLKYVTFPVGKVFSFYI